MKVVFFFFLFFKNIFFLGETRNEVLEMILKLTLELKVYGKLYEDYYVLKEIKLF